jgi:cytochrome bd ubiquinol oxidase subunit II
MMGFIWFWLVALMIVAYVVLDGFDLGVGVLHLFLPRSDAERRTMRRSIGPVWDGNEVWLLAGGGTLYFAFPLLYASAFSGFYLPLMIVLWLLVLRGVSLELRNHLDLGVWRTLLDGVFGLASALLAIFYGAALANVLRGVPINADGYFFLPLWTNWRPGANPGILDWYTIIGGLVAVVALTLHGALWLTIKTSGELEQRARRVVAPLLGLLVALTAVSLIATIAVRPASLDNYFQYPATFIVPVGVVAALAGIWFWNGKAQPLRAFLASCTYLLLMLAGGVWGLYPDLLPATNGSDNSITVERALSGPHTLSVGLVWWSFGMALAVGYIVFVYSRFQGKTDQTEGPDHPGIIAPN